MLLLVVSTTSHANHQLNEEQKLGELLFQDKKLSLKKNQACASCHSLKPADGKNLVTHWVPGFVDPDNVKKGTAVSKGSVAGATGALNAPSIAYAAFSPLFHFDENEGLYIGGQFWNGRASDLSEQAKKPFLNPVEMAMPNEWAVVERIKQQQKYKHLFWKVYGINLDETPGNQVKNVPRDETPYSVLNVFNLAAKAISEFEKTSTFNKFTSKFDYVLAGKTTFTDLEAKGLGLFNGKANCAACHISKVTVNDNGELVPPMFTDFTYDNIGLPRNVNIPNNPEPNLGLGERSDIAQADPEGLEIGKHKVMSLRNIALTPPYGHNGVLATLEQVVHFYNTRDILGTVSDNNDQKFGKSGWPMAEVAENVNHDELGNLGLTEEEEKAIVAFLKTLTDDYQKWGRDNQVPPWSSIPIGSGEPRTARSNSSRPFPGLGTFLSSK